LATGEIQAPEQVAGRLARCWPQPLPCPSVVVSGCARPSAWGNRWWKAVCFYFATVTAKVAALSLPQALETALCAHLIPAL
jgi:hypothetical protein